MIRGVDRPRRFIALTTRLPYPHLSRPRSRCLPCARLLISPSLGSGRRLKMMSKTAEKPVPSFILAIGGAALVAAGLWASLQSQSWIGAALFGALGLIAWR